MCVDPMLVAAQSQVAAAWVQAAGSIAAIIAAFFFPLWLDHAKRKAARKDLLGKLTALAFEVRDMAVAVAKTYASEGTLYSARLADDPNEYVPLIDALQSFPTYTLADRVHLTALMHLRRYARNVDNLWRIAVSHGEDMSDNWEAREQADDLAKETASFAEGVAGFK